MSHLHPLIQLRLPLHPISTAASGEKFICCSHIVDPHRPDATALRRGVQHVGTQH